MTSQNDCIQPPRMANWLASLLIGCVVALAAKRREMVATVMLAAILCAMTGVVVVLSAAKGHTSILWMLRWNVADWFAIMMGGTIVRKHRTAASALGDIVCQRLLPTRGNSE
jgi:hypothetical protein